jgi:uncharacterized protein with ParB-like and HNH nuclease domain
MTLTEKYHKYVLDYIKENPAFSSYYEPMLDFDEWIYNYMIEFADWLLIEPEDDSMENCTTKELLEIFKKEKGL